MKTSIVHFLNGLNFFHDLTVTVGRLKILSWRDDADSVHNKIIKNKEAILNHLKEDYPSDELELALNCDPLWYTLAQSIDPVDLVAYWNQEA